jgi:hypothetical protein
MPHCHIPPKASLVLSLLILLGVGCISFGEQANASSDNCTLKNVKGAFGATFTGSLPPPTIMWPRGRSPPDPRGPLP